MLKGVADYQKKSVPESRAVHFQLRFACDSPTLFLN